jgi:hypothetical protein
MLAFWKMEVLLVVFSGLVSLPQSLLIKHSPSWTHWGEVFAQKSMSSCLKRFSGWCLCFICLALNSYALGCHMPMEDLSHIMVCKRWSHSYGRPLLTVIEKTI